MPLPEQDKFHLGPIRIFGPGQDANQAEFELLMIARDSKPTGTKLPALGDARDTMDRGLEDPVLRDLISCEAGDFPVFWDVRSQLALPDLQERAEMAGCARVGHLTMGRLTVLDREDI